MQQHKLQAGNGLLLLGSTGEGLALTRDEQLSIVEFVCNLALNTPLMVAVGGSNLPEQISWIEHCNNLPIDSFLLGTPLYAKPGVVGQTQWFYCAVRFSRISMHAIQRTFSKWCGNSRRDCTKLTKSS